MLFRSQQQHGLELAGGVPGGACQGLRAPGAGSVDGSQGGGRVQPPLGSQPELPGNLPGTALIVLAVPVCKVRRTHKKRQVLLWSSHRLLSWARPLFIAMVSILGANG